MANRTLLITQANGEELQIDIPEEWKVTFGPVAIAGGHGAGQQKMPMALRVYESEKMQRAVFIDVKSFRDMSIPIRVKQENIQTKDGIVEVDGARKRTTFQATTVEWKDPDDVDSESDPKLISMPSDQEIFQGVSDEGGQ